MRILLRTLEPGEKHPYPTAGNWKFHADGSIECIVSKMDSKISEFAVAMHEAFESFFCQLNGIKEQDVTDFDVDFEKKRAAGLFSATEDPGDQVDACYHEPHKLATLIEMTVVTGLGKTWAEHDQTVNAAV